MKWSVYRDVALDQQAQDFVDGVSAEAKRFEDQWRGVEWLLARTPENGTPRFPNDATKYLIYVFPGNPWAETRDLWVLYSYDDDRVVIHLARFGVEYE